LIINTSGNNCPSKQRTARMMWAKAKGKESFMSFNTVDLRLISLDTRLQMRAATSPEVIEEYRRLLAEAMESKNPKYPEPEWPFNEPVRLFNVRASDGLYLIADGFHRVLAAREAGWKWVRATIVDGTLEDATLAAITANATHGLPRNQADRRRAVKAALNHPKLVGQTDREIARLCNVSHPTVATIRREIAAEAEVVNLPVNDPVTAIWAGLSNTVLHHHVSTWACFRWQVVWSLFAYGVSDLAIARRSGLPIEQVRRILRPLENQVDPPSCIHSDDRELWTSIFRGTISEYYALRLEMLSNTPGMPTNRLRDQLKQYQLIADKTPRLADFSTEESFAFRVAVESAARDWFDTGVIDSRSVQAEIDELVSYLKSDECRSDLKAAEMELETCER
jgi:hypothetical protein